MHHIQSRDLPDELSVAVFYQRHALMVLTYIRSHVASKEEAEDILGDVFLAVLENQTPFTLDEREQAIWLRRVAHNKVVDRYRRQMRQPEITSLGEFAHILPGEKNGEPEIVAVRNENRAQLHIHLAALSADQQKVLHLRFAENLSTREIARLLNKSDVAIRSLLSRTLNRLRHIWETQQKGKANHG
jgi:RNA polymerase sigma factor (sigma-70 family)